MNRHFCTLFDSNYLLKGVAMLQSLVAVSPGARIFVLCMDATTKGVLEGLSIAGVICVDLAEVETRELLEVKEKRSVAEYCWTLSPCLPWHILDRYADIEQITYVDADLLFYSSVKPIFDEIGLASVAIIEHRFIPRLKYLEANGRFCVQWVSFRRDKEGLACLTRWRQQCLAWCFNRLEDGRFGDQKYLDEWPQLVQSLKIVEHLGAGVAPWNYSQYEIVLSKRDEITVDGAPLIFYHFHQFQLLNNGRFDWVSAFYTTEKQPPVQIYETYEAVLKRVLFEVRKVAPGFSAGLKPAAQIAWRRRIQRFVPRRWKEMLRKFVRI